MIISSAIRARVRVSSIVAPSCYDDGQTTRSPCDHERGPTLILLRDRHLHAACFDEIDLAVRKILADRLDDRAVAFNAHSVPPHAVPAGAIVFNLENVGIQVSTDMFAGHEIWDFSARNVERWRDAGRDARHVPVGYHPSMTRFSPLPWQDRDIDVVFTGCLNDRRARVLDDLVQRGLRVRSLTGVYGSDRDSVLARSRVAINMLFYPGGVFPALRSAHLVANRIAVVSECAAEEPSWVTPLSVSYDALADRVAFLARDSSQEEADVIAANAFAALSKSPLLLPTDKGASPPNIAKGASPSSRPGS